MFAAKCSQQLFPRLIALAIDGDLTQRFIARSPRDLSRCYAHEAVPIVSHVRYGHSDFAGDNVIWANLPPSHDRSCPSSLPEFWEPMHNAKTLTACHVTIDSILLLLLYITCRYSEIEGRISRICAANKDLS